VACPESQAAQATQQPARHTLGEASAAKKGSSKAEAAEPERVAPPPVATVPPPAREPELKEQHYTIYYDDTGHSYESIIAPYLRGAKKVIVEDPYIRIPHQIQNFVRLCAVALTNSTARQIKLITGYDDEGQRADAQNKLSDLQQSLLEQDIVLELEFSATMHDREIRIDNGWVIKIGRGLDFYQKPTSRFEVGANDLSLRKCLETKVDIFRVTKGGL